MIELASRSNTGSLKWDEKENVLPMWVADMDFKSPKEIRECITQRANIGAFGYSIIPNELFDAYYEFHKRHHDIEYNKESMIFTTGVVPAISSMVRSLTNVAERVVLLTPVYNIFFNSIYNNGRVIRECPLNYKNNEYSINFKLLEEELSHPQATLLILCNPANPVGRIWTYAELKQIVDLCIKYDVTIISDEIHSGITREGFEYTPIYKVYGASDISVVCTSPSKCYNIAGLSSALVIADNKRLYKKVNRGLNTDEVAETGFFGAFTTITALNDCDYYLKEVNEYIDENFKLYSNYLVNNIKELKMVDSKCTYLVWLDISALNISSKEFCKYLLEKHSLFITEGDEYGKAGEGFVRINLATSHENVLKSLEILKLAVSELTNK